MNTDTLKQQLQDGERLDGWKRIANHLQCDVRTAKRWEKDRDLPIHRHHHAKRASVYAFVDELALWDQGIVPDTVLPADAPVEPWIVSGVVGTSALLVIGALAWLAQGPELTNTGFESQGATPAFAPVLATGLERPWTDNDWLDYSVATDGWNFAWKTETPLGLEVFTWRNGVVEQITHDQIDQGWVAIDGDRLAWMEGTECYVPKAEHESTWDCTVFVHEFGETRAITEGIHWEGGPIARDGSMVWERGMGDGNLDIWMYRHGDLFPITGSPWPDIGPVVSGDRVVWTSIVDNERWELFEYDGSLITQLTDDEVRDRQPSIDGDWLAWVRNDGNDDEIMLSDGAEQWQLSDNDYDDVKPKVWNGRVAWIMKTDPTSGDGHEVMAFDGERVYRLTDDRQLDWQPVAGEEWLVWHRQIGADLEIVAVAWTDLAAVGIDDGGLK